MALALAGDENDQPVPRSSAPFPDDAPFVNFASQLPLPETHRLTMPQKKTPIFRT